jgi:hypothetical protein
MASKGKLSLRGAKLTHRFKDETGKPWRVVEASRRAHPKMFDGPGAVGCTWFKERIIVIDSDQGEYEKFETLMHELTHVSWRDLGLNEFIEEEIVEQTSAKLTRYLDQILS